MIDFLKNLNLADSFISEQTREKTIKLLSYYNLEELRTAVDEYIYKARLREKTFTDPVQSEEVIILLTVAFEKIRALKKSSKKLNLEQILFVIEEMDYAWLRLYVSSAFYVKPSEEERPFWDLEQRKAIYRQNCHRYATNILLQFMKLIGEIQSTNKIVKKLIEERILLSYNDYKWKDEEKLKSILLPIFQQASHLDDLYMDILDVITDERAVNRMTNVATDKALVSYYKIIDRLEPADNWLVITEFLDRAIKALYKSENTKNKLIKYLDKKKEALRNPQPVTPTSVTNNFNAPIGQYAQNIENQELKK